MDPDTTPPPSAAEELTLPEELPATLAERADVLAEAGIDRVWRDERRHLVGLATRMLGDPAAAEDVVQEAFGQLLRVGLHGIRDARGWLTVVVRRLCLNRLRSAYARRESATGAAPSEVAPARGGRPGEDDPADRVSLDGQVQQAMAVVLERLTPAERTSFVLHDVFGFPYQAIGQIVGRNPTACRQLASRARRAVRAAPPTAPDGPPGSGADGAAGEEGSLLAERFIAASAGGDIAELVALLDPDVVGEARLQDHGLLRRVEGAHVVATEVVQLFGPDTGAVLVPVPVERRSGIVVAFRGRVHAVLRLEERDGVVHHIESYVLRQRPHR